MKKLLIAVGGVVLVGVGYLFYAFALKPIEIDPSLAEGRMTARSSQSPVDESAEEAVIEAQIAKEEQEFKDKEARQVKVKEKVKAVAPKAESVLDLSDEEFAEFRDAFNSLTDEEKEEEARRGVVEWEDKSYPILAKLMMDASQPKDVLRLIYDDLATRDWDKIRIPMLKRIAAVKDHPFAEEAKEDLEALLAIQAKKKAK